MTHGYVIITHNQPKQLKWILNSLAKQKIDKIVVIDNNSTIDYETPENVIYYKLEYDKKHDFRSMARNKGIEFCDTNIVTFLDGDCIPEYDFSEYVKLYYMDKFNSKNIFLPNRMDVYNKKELKRRLKKIYFSINVSNLRIQSLQEDGNIFASFGFSVLRNWIIEVGKFDENFNGWGFEDIDLSYRMREKGSRFLINPMLYVYHLAHPRPEYMQKMKSIILNNAKLLYQKHKKDITRFYLQKHLNIWGFSQNEIQNVIGVF